MEENEIKVMVIGGVGSGKTTIATHLSNVLKMSGYRVTMVDELFNDPPLTYNEIERNREALQKKGLKIVVETNQVNKEAFKYDEYQ